MYEDNVKQQKLKMASGNIFISKWQDLLFPVQFDSISIGLPFSWMLQRNVVEEFGPELLMNKWQVIILDQTWQFQSMIKEYLAAMTCIFFPHRMNAAGLFIQGKFPIAKKEMT